MAISMSRDTPSGGGTPLQAGENTGLGNLITDIVVGFGWDIIVSNSPDVELVPSVVLIGSDGRAVDPDAMVFFNQLATPDGSVQYVTNGDQEQVEVSLSIIPENVERLLFVVYVDPDVRRPGTFSSVRSCYIRIADQRDDEIARFTMTSPVRDASALIFGELYRYKGKWKFRALGDGYAAGMSAVATDFGLVL